MSYPSTTCDVSTSILLRRGVTARKNCATNLAEFSNVQETALRNLEVGKDVVLIDLGHQAMGELLFDIRLWTLWIDCRRGPMVASCDAVRVNVYECPMKGV